MAIPLLWLDKHRAPRYQIRLPRWGQPVGEMSESAEGARLLSVYTGNCIESSNLSLSASKE